MEKILKGSVMEITLYSLLKVLIVALAAILIFQYVR